MAVRPLFMKVSCLLDRGTASLNYNKMFVSFVYYVLYFYIKSDFDKEHEINLFENTSDNLTEIL